MERDRQTIAIEFEGTTLTYSKLNAYSNQLAHNLITNSGCQALGDHSVPVIDLEKPLPPDLATDNPD